VKTAVALPANYIVRPPEPGDAAAIFDLRSAYNKAVIGFADCTLDEVAESIVEPGFDRMTDAWLVLGGDGEPTGYATAFGKGDCQTVEIEVASQDPAVAAWLLDHALDRAREMGRKRGHAEITIDSCIYQADERLGALFAEHDFITGTTYHRMRIDHIGPVAAAEVPADVVVRRGAFDDASRRAAHDVLIDSFRGQYGFVPRPHDEWIEVREAQATFDWSQLTVLEVNRRAVAIRDCSDAYVETENCGHIGMLGVVERFRGRGLAKYLLYDAFALDAAAGRTGTILHVDVNNPSQALRLYQSVGMAPTLVQAGYRRTLQVT
jgi:ribosomal protein S18 acetylase RimI-like enzyme